MHPGQRNSLDALCKRYDIDNTHRELHGALLDAEILADVFLSMTGGQTALSFQSSDARALPEQSISNSLTTQRLQKTQSLKVIVASPDEEALHEQRLQAIDKASDASTLWRQ